MSFAPCLLIVRVNIIGRSEYKELVYYTKVIFISNCFISNQAQFPEILLYNDVIVIT